MERGSEALAWAASLRGARSEVCDQLAAGSATLAEVLHARSDPRVGEVQLLAVLESLPGASKIATRRRLAKMHLEGRRRLLDLDEREVAAVIDAFGSSDDPGERSGT